MKRSLIGLRKQFDKRKPHEYLWCVPWKYRTLYEKGSEVIRGGRKLVLTGEKNKAGARTGKKYLRVILGVNSYKMILSQETQIKYNFIGIHWLEHMLDRWIAEFTWVRGWSTLRVGCIPRDNWNHRHPSAESRICPFFQTRKFWVHHWICRRGVGRDVGVKKANNFYLGKFYFWVFQFQNQISRMLFKTEI